MMMVPSVFLLEWLMVPVHFFLQTHEVISFSVTVHIWQSTSIMIGLVVLFFFFVTCWMIITVGPFLAIIFSQVRVHAI